MQTLPAEALEHISSYLLEDRRDFLKLRIAGPEIGRKTFHFFTKNLSDKLKWDLSNIVNPNYFLPKDNELWKTKTIADVEYIPELAKRIRELKLTFKNKLKIAR